MSAQDDDGFLARWARRKQQARVEPEPAAKADVEAEPAAAAPEEPFDLELLPKLDDITAETDVTVFLHKAVPESLRNAALKRAWLLDPAIRDYVNPAMEYAYDWNTPGMSPSSPLEATYDALGEMARILSSGSDQTLVEDGQPKTPDDLLSAPPQTPMASVDPDREARGQSQLAAQQEPDETAESQQASDAQEEPRVVAPDRLRRSKPRHGGATPT